MDDLGKKIIGASLILSALCGLLALVRHPGMIVSILNVSYLLLLAGSVTLLISRINNK